MSLYSRIIDLQKLQAGWKRVKKNHPAAGVDGVTAEVFDSNVKENLKQLNLDLTAHKYEPYPVRIATIYKGEKARDIALYSMRDKVVQQSIAAELTKMYDDSFSEQTIAYRANKSALAGIQQIHERILTMQDEYVLRLDIHHFFESIVWKRLEGFLSERILEEDVLNLIRINCCGPKLDMTTGELSERQVGIYQGSGISPVLSNIYLMKFDNWLAATGHYFLRYSDDMIIFGKEEKEMVALLQEVTAQLDALGLKLSETKSFCGKIADGFTFLGYAFSPEGKSIPPKAEEDLSDRLETMWLTSGDVGIEERLKKALEILGGWEQYFREDREVASIVEFAAIVYGSAGGEKEQEHLAAIRLGLTNIYHDLTAYLADYWRGIGRSDLELLEFEQFYEMPAGNENNVKPSASLASELVANYRKYFITEDLDSAIELMQSYTDIGDYEKAAAWQEKADRIQKKPEISVIPVESMPTEFHVDKNTAEKLKKHFAGREDIYSQESIGYDKKRQSQLQPQALSSEIVNRHLAGAATIGTYIQRPNATVHFMVFDVDVSRKILLQYERGTEEFKTYLTQALHYSYDILKCLQNMGMRSYIEYSGSRGYHVWLLLSEWIPVRYANMFFEVMVAKLPEVPDGISLEQFPNRTHVKPGKYGQVLKLPLGVHIRTGERSYFLDESGNAVADVNTFLDSLSCQSLAAIKKVLAANPGQREPEKRIEVDNDISVFGENLDSGVKEVLTKCNLMRYLCLKAKNTAYLSHFERMSILYVFGHMGDAGKEFVHQVMGYTMNYSYNTTQRFIDKIPEKPVSCLKLRDQYPQITAEIGCSCSFKRTKGCYPSPVLHAISLSDDLQSGVTLPTSRTLTKEKEKMVMDEINIHVKAQELAKKILSMKKQQRDLDRSIRGVEKELCKIYDDAVIDCLEIEMGMLVRKKIGENGDYEWLIEIDKESSKSGASKMRALR